jgi:hypothetical protein
LRTNRSLWAVIAVAVLLALSAMSGAQSISDTSGTASVDVQPALSLSLIASPSWGQVVRPTSGTATYKLDYSTGVVSVVSGLGYAFNNGHLGEYTLSGAPTAPVAFSVSIGSFSGTGVTVVAAHINGTSSSGTDVLDGSGNLDLKVGGVLDIVSTASVEVQTATVTVTVDYN